MSTSDWQAAPLQWGRGETSFEVFIEPTCPFSVKAMRKLAPLLDSLGDDAARVQLWMQSQPWHQFSPVVTRCVLAASTLPDGRDKAWSVLESVADHREEFVMIDHCSGPQRDSSPNDIIARLEDYSGVALADAFAIPDLEREMKRHARYARQNGIHVSPSFMINGLVDASLGSGDSVAHWAAAIRAAS